MSQQLPDPTRWLTDLMTAEHTVLWPAGDVSGAAQALAAAAAPWTKAVTDLASWQFNALQQLAAPWLAALPGAEANEASKPNKAKDKRFAGEAWSKDPRFDTLAQTYQQQTELMQLIQYAPATDTVRKRPLVIVPPCINKYYILDLQSANSFVAHAVGKQQTVFLVSWRNAGPEQATLTWDDYLEQGVLTAMDVARPSPGPTRSTRSASASAARCWPARSPSRPLAARIPRPA
jgi:hypothetical protein